MQSIIWDPDLERFEYCGRNAVWNKDVLEKFKHPQGFSICHKISFKTIATGIVNSLNYFHYYLMNPDYEVPLQISLGFLAGMIVSVKGQQICLPESCRELKEVNEKISQFRALQIPEEDNEFQQILDKQNQMTADLLESTKVTACSSRKYARILNAISEQMEACVNCRDEIIQVQDRFNQYADDFKNNVLEFLTDIPDAKISYIIKRLGEITANYWLPDLNILLNRLIQKTTGKSITLLKKYLKEKCRKYKDMINNQIRNTSDELIDLQDTAVQHEITEDPYYKSLEDAVEQIETETRLYIYSDLLKLLDAVPGTMDAAYVLTRFGQFINDENQIFQLRNCLDVFDACCNNYMSHIAYEADRFIQELNCETANLKLGCSLWNQSLQDAYDCEFWIYEDGSNTEFLLPSAFDAIQLSNLLHLTLGEHIPFGSKDSEPITSTALYFLAGTVEDEDKDTGPVNFIYTSSLPMEFESCHLKDLKECRIYYYDYILGSKESIDAGSCGSIEAEIQNAIEQENAGLDEEEISPS